MPQGSDFDRYCPPVKLGAFSILENKIIGYAYEFNLIAVVPSSGVRVAVKLESMKRDLGKDCNWCNFSGMKLNTSKTKK